MVRPRDNGDMEQMYENGLHRWTVDSPFDQLLFGRELFGLTKDSEI